MSEQRPVASLEPLAPVMNLIAQEVTLDSLTESVKVLRDQIKAIVPQYAAANYSEDNIKDAKADRATLNKFAKVLNDKKIAFKNEFMKPYEAFEAIVKDAISIIDGAASNIDKVVKEVEGRERMARQAMIEELWAATGFTTVPLSQVQKSEWMVKATSKKAICEGISEVQDGITSNVALLEQMVKPEDRLAVKNYYLFDLDFKKSVTYAQKLKFDREEKERQERAEEERKNQPISSPPLPPAPPPPPPSTVPPVTPPPPPLTTEARTLEADPIISRTFKVTVPTSKMVKLGDFMFQNGIPFEVVAKG